MAVLYVRLNKMPKKIAPSSSHRLSGHTDKRADTDICRYNSLCFEVYVYISLSLLHSSETISCMIAAIDRYSEPIINQPYQRFSRKKDK